MCPRDRMAKSTGSEGSEASDFTTAETSPVVLGATKHAGWTALDCKEK
jgi:hypothetical protein